MLIQNHPAAAGWQWLREALAIFRKQPFAFTALIVLYSMVLMVLASLPLVGLPLVAMMTPFGTVGITQAGREMARGVMPLPSLLIAPFRDSMQRIPLLRLGAVNGALLTVMALVSWLLAADDISKWQIVDGQLDPESIAQHLPVSAIVTTAVLYVPVLMLTWFSPVLVAWHKMPLGKAMFFSFFACWRNRWPFLLLGMLLFALLMGSAFGSSMLLRAIGISQQVASIIFGPIALLLTALVYATLYPVYRAVIVPNINEVLAEPIEA